ELVEAERAGAGDARRHTERTRVDFLHGEVESLTPETVKIKSVPQRRADFVESGAAGQDALVPLPPQQRTWIAEAGDRLRQGGTERLFDMEDGPPSRRFKVLRDAFPIDIGICAV